MSAFEAVLASLSKERQSCNKTHVLDFQPIPGLSEGKAESLPQPTGNVYLRTPPIISKLS